MTPAEGLHVGRWWTGHATEDSCRCPQEPCGLIDMAKIEASCPQHGAAAMKTIRQSHQAADCPGATPVEP